MATELQKDRKSNSFNSTESTGLLERTQKLLPCYFCHLSKFFYALNDVTWREREPRLLEFQVDQSESLSFLLLVRFEVF